MEGSSKRVGSGARSEKNPMKAAWLEEAPIEGFQHGKGKTNAQRCQRVDEDPEPDSTDDEASDDDE